MTSLVGSLYTCSLHRKHAWRRIVTTLVDFSIIEKAKVFGNRLTGFEYNNGLFSEPCFYYLWGCERIGRIQVMQLVQCLSQRRYKGETAFLIIVSVVISHASFKAWQV